jgi:CBS domain containing-hemolysin-like protein
VGGGGQGARYALGLAADPTRFHSSVQVIISSFGTLSGAIGEATIAVPIQTAHEVVTNVLNLDDRHVAVVLTRRVDVVLLEFARTP